MSLPSSINLQFLLILTLQLVSCSTSHDSDDPSSRSNNQKGEYIYRKHNEVFFNVPPPERTLQKPHSWQYASQNNLPEVTKEFFICKGNILNPPHNVKQNNNTENIYDCAGCQTHTLPIRNGKEFIYPILIELLNFIQDTTKKRIVITSGHRCPAHNTYVDMAVSNQYSKHTIGAEVDFYVEGMETEPNKIVDIIQQYYTTNPQYQGKKEYEIFTRYDKGDANVSIMPWFNKEVFVKIYSKTEGRNFDNNHPHPYIAIQVRHDRDLNEKSHILMGKSYQKLLQKITIEIFASHKLYSRFLTCRCGEIGRRGRLKIYSSQEGAGSSPVIGITTEAFIRRSSVFYFQIQI